MKTHYLHGFKTDQRSWPNKRKINTSLTMFWEPAVASLGRNTSMKTNAWISEVLDDIEAFAIKNHLPKVALGIEELRLFAWEELGDGAGNQYRPFPMKGENFLTICEIGSGCSEERKISSD